MVKLPTAAKVRKEAAAAEEETAAASADCTQRQLRLYQLVIAVLVAACFYHFSQDYFLLAIPIAETTQTHPSNHSHTDIAGTHTATETVHVLFGLSGNHDGFFAEFEVCLKSVLMNAPHDAALGIHIMADQDANDKLHQDLWPKIFTNMSQADDQTKIATTGLLWFTNVTITIYNVEAQLEPWGKFLDTQTHQSFHNLGNIHTVGAFFRLFAHQVIQGVDHILYMDTDVVILANLAAVYREVPTSATWLIQMSWQCDGFAFIHLPQMNHFWQLIEQIDFSQRSKRHDQDLVLAIQEIFDQKNTSKPLKDWYIQNVSKPWDLYVTRDWRHPSTPDLLAYRPQVGAVHYNGGGAAKQAYFVNNEAWVNGPNARGGWGLAATFYRDLSWSWAFYMGQSMGRLDPNTQIRLASP